MRGLFWLALIGVLLAGGAVVTAQITRGLRNNNPGNIRRSADQWLGLSPTQSDPEFFQFVDPVYGLRAMARIVKNYHERYGLDTVAKIVARWSPPSENPTAELTDGAAARLQVHPHATIDVRARLPEIVAALVRQENGVQPYPDELIRRAVAMA